MNEFELADLLSKREAAQNFKADQHSLSTNDISSISRPSPRPEDPRPRRKSLDLQKFMSFSEEDYPLHCVNELDRPLRLNLFEIFQEDYLPMHRSSFDELEFGERKEVPLSVKGIEKNRKHQNTRFFETFFNYSRLDEADTLFGNFADDFLIDELLDDQILNWSTNPYLRFLQEDLKQESQIPLEMINSSDEAKDQPQNLQNNQLPKEIINFQSELESPSCQEKASWPDLNKKDVVDDKPWLNPEEDDSSEEILNKLELELPPLDLKLQEIAEFFSSENLEGFQKFRDIITSHHKRDPEKKPGRKIQCPELEHYLTEWSLQYIFVNRLVPSKAETTQKSFALWKRIQKMARNLKHTDFRCSKGWHDKYTKRHSAEFTTALKILGKITLSQKSKNFRDKSGSQPARPLPEHSLEQASSAEKGFMEPFSQSLTKRSPKKEKEEEAELPGQGLISRLRKTPRRCKKKNQ